MYLSQQQVELSKV